MLISEFVFWGILVPFISLQFAKNNNTDTIILWRKFYWLLRIWQ